MARQRIIPIRREYNRWVANQTLEDYALRFTAKSARRFSNDRISQTAIGAISFLALEAIGGAITLSYGTTNAIIAIVVASLAILLIGLPIARYATKHGVDVDLLTRGASFGYIGSTITSLIYASFTFILFAIEASIMSSALQLAFGIPLWLGYIISAVVVIPLVTHGVQMISRFQLITQPVWVVLNILPFFFIAFLDWDKFDLWRSFAGLGAPEGVAGSIAPFDLAKFGAASAVILALMTQIGEQVDFLRFLPAEGVSKWRHKVAIFLAGAGWVVVGAPKLLAGSFLAYLALSSGVSPEHASEPGHMYAVAFGYMVPNEFMALMLMAVFVVISQLKINVMNAYAGSLAWSNFFSRLTHSHPGRVVWLLFNVAIALLLMELGIYRLLEETLGIFSIIAMAWLCSISADLFVNKPLGLAPPGIEFKRAHLYDINPVGVGSMLLATTIALMAHFGLFGETAAALSSYVALVVAFIASPTIAWATKGKYYLARKPRKQWQTLDSVTCSICQHPFEPEDMAWCPAYAAPICSLCCSLDARCHDMCKPHAHFRAQTHAVAASILPEWAIAKLQTRLGRYSISMAIAVAMLGGALWLIYYFAAGAAPHTADVVGGTLAVVFFVFAVTAGIITWFLVLAHDSRLVAEEESSRQNTLLLKEIDAHSRTDAALQRAKEKAEAANQAKSRYVVGLSHELRTPLNAVMGYAQVLERDAGLPENRRGSVQIIRRSAEHLSGLIDGLLDISKIEAGRLQVYSNEINIQDFLDQIVDMFSLQAKVKGLEFRHERARALPTHVRTDEKRLRQILVNLLSNAIKFTNEGHVSFKVEYRNQVANFVVEDSGTGIAAGDIEHVFEPFVRGEAERNRFVPGLGLGLTITKLLTETLGGEISLTSTIDVGTRFQARLMLSKVERPQAAHADIRRVVGYKGPSRTVMVVDDNADHRDLVREMLSPLGFVVLSVKDGSGCLQGIEAHRPDVYFLDIRMPGMNGWELAQALRDRAVVAPIIMLSANIGDGAGPTNSDAGHTDTLAKPFELNQLLEKLAAHLALEWDYAEQAVAASGNGASKLLSPGAEHLRELVSLGQIGHVRGIEAKLGELAREAANRPLVDALSAHLAAFDFESYAELIERVSHEPD
ncbi:ATP-binding protein [Devosia neptuniae]|jgi:signal transduction histidine kinase/CheY-like chemotaxis protein/purine-cytosine permease-like protein|uniref:hybrid sensor histidine kinase/response regulator n=1 Tax=Devosia TaxID=46913 RepID=UPI0022B014F7|nr:ATP-binding protein [Devosia neptuniae]MCZ4345663.1 response regulator [Devosia neptuniae]|tara:strand:- start:3601 stop:6975 length:3375 start_codon:yes stop_codon:yes gene_type:complete